jgi:hypothetical protein
MSNSSYARYYDARTDSACKSFIPVIELGHIPKGCLLTNWGPSNHVTGATRATIQGVNGACGISQVVCRIVIISWPWYAKRIDEQLGHVVVKGEKGFPEKYIHVMEV